MMQRFGQHVPDPRDPPGPPGAPLTFISSGPGLEVISAPALAREGRWTVLAAAHHHSQSLVDSTLRELSRGRSTRSLLPPVACAVVVHDAVAGTLDVTTAVSPGSSLAFAAISGPGTVGPHEGGEGGIAPRWAFSNRLTSLFEVLGRIPPLDPQRLAGFMLVVRGNGPPYRDVEWIGQGSTLSLCAGRPPRVAQWIEIACEPMTGSVESFVEQYCAAIDEVIAAELPPAGDVSALMSAGLDSTMVAGTAAKVIGPHRTVHAYCLDPIPPHAGTGDIGNWRYTDLPDARAMQTLWPNLIVRGLRNDRRETMLDVLPRYFAATALPVFNPTNAVWLYEGARRAAALGTSVLLTGQSGNRTFSWEPSGAYRHMLLTARPGALLDAMRARSGSLGTSMWWEAGRLVQQCLPRSVRRSVTIRGLATGAPVRRHATPDHLAAGAYLAPDAVARLGLLPMLERSVVDPAASARSWWHPGYVGTGLSLPASPVVDLREADPLAAEPLVRLVARLPVEAFVGVADGRSFARRTMRARVPDVIRLRTARGMQAADNAHWRPDQEAIRELLAQARSSSSINEVIDLERLVRASLGREMPPPESRSGVDRALGMVAFMNAQGGYA